MVYIKHKRRNNRTIGNNGMLQDCRSTRSTRSTRSVNSSNSKRGLPQIDSVPQFSVCPHIASKYDLFVLHFQFSIHCKCSRWTMFSLLLFASLFAFSVNNIIIICLFLTNE